MSQHKKEALHSFMLISNVYFYIILTASTGFPYKRCGPLYQSVIVFQNYDQKIALELSADQLPQFFLLTQTLPHTHDKERRRHEKGQGKIEGGKRQLISDILITSDLMKW